MRVNGSAQTITLTLTSRLDQKNSMPDEYSVNVYQLSGDFQKWIETDTSSSYYSISTFKDNETPGIKIELKENSTGEDRTIRLIIESNIGYGIVDLTQQSFSTTTYSFFSKAKYKGRIYTSDAKTTVSGDIIYFDPEYACLMEKIDTMENITMMIMEDSTIFYYDKEDMKANKPYEDIISLDNSVEQYFGAATRADGFEYDDPTYLGYIAIFDNDHFKGSKITKGLTNFHLSYSLQDLKQYSMNDKVTSIAVSYNSQDPLVCSVLTIWEDTNYNYGDDNRSKHRISIIASKNSPKTAIPDLKKIKRIGSSKSWNDCISSISFHFGYIDRLLLDY